MLVLSSFLQWLEPNPRTNLAGAVGAFSSWVFVSLWAGAHAFQLFSSSQLLGLQWLEPC